MIYLNLFQCLQCSIAITGFFYFIYYFRSATRPPPFLYVIEYITPRCPFLSVPPTLLRKQRRNDIRKQKSLGEARYEHKSRTYNFLRKLVHRPFMTDATFVSRGPNFSTAHGNPFSHVKMSPTDVAR